MSRLATSFVLGYHGCDRSTAEKAVNGDISIIQSNKDFDWLGPGAYFWESDPKRAREWAEWKAARGDYRHPAIVGAVIDLRHCLDLMNRDDVELVKAAHGSFKSMRRTAGLPLPENRSAKGQPNADRVLRFWIALYSATSTVFWRRNQRSIPSIRFAECSPKGRKPIRDAAFRSGVMSRSPFATTLVYADYSFRAESRTG